MGGGGSKPNKGFTPRGNDGGGGEEYFEASPLGLEEETLPFFLFE
jgi:hypothetical protein